MDRAPFPGSYSLTPFRNLVVVEILWHPDPGMPTGGPEYSPLDTGLMIGAAVLAVGRVLATPTKPSPKPAPRESMEIPQELRGAMEAAQSLMYGVRADLPIVEVGDIVVFRWGSEIEIPVEGFDRACVVSLEYFVGKLE